MRRVVITGLGCVSSLACGVEDTWQGMLEGKSGIKAISHIDVSEVRTKICGLVSGYNEEDHFSKKEIRKMDPFIQYAMVAADEAIASSGIQFAVDII